LAKNVRPYSKNKSKRAGDMIQMVECLPNKHKTLNSSTTQKRKRKNLFLSSNPSPTKKKKYSLVYGIQGRIKKI
jgi:hypothetical protein